MKQKFVWILIICLCIVVISGCTNFNGTTITPTFTPTPTSTSTITSTPTLSPSRVPSLTITIAPSPTPEPTSIPITGLDVTRVQTDRGNILQYTLHGGDKNHGYFYEQWIRGHTELGPNQGILKPEVATKANTDPGQGSFVIKVYYTYKIDPGLGWIPDGPLLYVKDFSQ